MHNLVAIAYVVSGILFITALRGLSSPESSRRGNVYGIIGMVIAVFATLVSVRPFSCICCSCRFLCPRIISHWYIGAHQHAKLS